MTFFVEMDTRAGTVEFDLRDLVAVGWTWFQPNDPMSVGDIRLYLRGRNEAVVVTTTQVGQDRLRALWYAARAPGPAGAPARIRMHSGVDGSP